MKATYTNSGVRRQDRLLGLEQALTLLQNGEHGVLSMTCRDGQAYGIPVNYVWNGREAIYLHCAPEGRKLDCIRFNNHVSFCVTGKTKVIPEKFTTGYESIVLDCMAHIHLPPEERMDALLMLAGKYSPEYRDSGRKHAENSFDVTEIIRLDICQWSGKCREIPGQKS